MCRGLSRVFYCFISWQVWAMLTWRTGCCASPRPSCASPASASASPWWLWLNCGKRGSWIWMLQCRNMSLNFQKRSTRVKRYVIVYCQEFFIFLFLSLYSYLCTGAWSGPIPIKHSKSFRQVLIFPAQKSIFGSSHLYQVCVHIYTFFSILCLICDI